MTRSSRRIRAVVARVVRAATMDRLVDPILTDIELERRESVRRVRPWRARWIVLSGYVGLGRALAHHGALELARKATSGESGARAVRSSAAAFAVVTLALMLPPWWATPDSLQADRGLLALTLVPQTIPISLPLAAAFGMAVAWPTRAIGRALLRRALVFGITGMLLTAATMEWLIPAGSQAFRQIVFRHVTEAGVDPSSIHLSRGFAERPLSELIMLVWQSTPARADRQQHANANTAISAQDATTFEPSRLKQHLQVRLVLCVATAVLCFLAAALATAVPGRNLAKIIFTAATAVYVVTFFWIPALARVVSPSLAPWLPTAGLALASAVLLRVRRLTPSN